MERSPQRIPGWSVGLSRLNGLHRRYCVFTSAQVKHITFVWQAVQDCTSFSLRHPPVFLDKRVGEGSWIHGSEDWLLTCRRKMISELPSHLRSVSHDKQPSCLSSGRCVTDTVKRIMRHLSSATGPWARGDWAHGGCHCCCLCQCKDALGSLCLGRCRSDPPRTGYRFAHPRGRRRGVSCCVLHQETTHPFSFCCRETWRKRDWSEKEVTGRWKKNYASTFWE